MEDKMQYINAGNQTENVYDELKNHRILEGMRLVIAKHASIRNYKQEIKKLNQEIALDESRRTFLGKMKALFRKSSRYSHMNPKNKRKFRDLLSQEERIFSDIVSSGNNLDLQDLEFRLVEQEQKWVTEWAPHAGYLEREMLFQFPYRAQSQLQVYLDTPAERIRHVYSNSMENLWNYASRHSELAMTIVQKMAEIYTLDKERGKLGKRWLGYVSGGMFPISLADCALTCIQNIGRHLSMNKEQIYHVAGLSPEQVNKDSKAWDLRACEIQRREGLGYKYE